MAHGHVLVRSFFILDGIFTDEEGHRGAFGLEKWNPVRILMCMTAVTGFIGDGVADLTGEAVGMNGVLDDAACAGYDVLVTGLAGRTFLPVVAMCVLLVVGSVHLVILVAIGTHKARLPEVDIGKVAFVLAEILITNTTTVACRASSRHWWRLLVDVPFEETSADTVRLAHMTLPTGSVTVIAVECLHFS